jgi:outer membrane protein assembly factor BamB
MTHSIKCPNCTAPIEFEAGEALAVRCPYCGMSTPIPEALRKKSQARNSVGLSDDAVARIVALIAGGNSADAIALIQRSTNVDLESARRLHDAMKSGDAAALNMLLHGQSTTRPVVVVRQRSCLGSLILWGIVLAIVGTIVSTVVSNVVGIAWLQQFTGLVPPAVSDRIDSVVEVVIPPFAGLVFQKNAMLTNDDDAQPDIVAIAFEPTTSKSLLVYVDVLSTSVRWRSEVDAQSTFVATDDAVYVATKSRLRAIDRASGATRWEASLSDEVSRACDACVLTSASHIFVLSSDAEVQAFDVADGRRTWSVTLSKIQPRIASWGDKLVVIDRDEDYEPHAAAQVRIFDAAGESPDSFHLSCDTPQTKNSAGGQEHADPDSAIHIDTAEGALYAWFGGFSSCVQKYSLADGALLWSAQVDARAEDERSTQFLRNGDTFYLVGDESILAANAMSGQTRILHVLDDDHDGMYLYGESAGTLVVHTTKTRGTRRYELRALDMQTGQIRWKTQFEEDGGPFTLDADYSGLLSNSEEEIAWTALVTPSAVRLLRIASKPFRFVFEDVDSTSGAATGRVEAPIAGDPLLLGPALIGRRSDALWVHVDRGFVVLDMNAKKSIRRISP